MSSLLGTCSFLDPRFKDKFTIEDETVVALMDEIIMLDEIERSNNMEQSTENHEDNLSAPPRKKGNLVQYLVRVLVVHPVLQELICTV